LGGRLSDRSDGPELNVKSVIGSHESDSVKVKVKKATEEEQVIKSPVMQDSENYRMFVARLDTSIVRNRNLKFFSFCMQRINQF